MSTWPLEPSQTSFVQATGLLVGESSAPPPCRQGVPVAASVTICWPFHVLVQPGLRRTRCAVVEIQEEHPQVPFPRVRGDAGELGRKWNRATGTGLPVQENAPLRTAKSTNLMRSLTTERKLSRWVAKVPDDRCLAILIPPSTNTSQRPSRQPVFVHTSPRRAEQSLRSWIQVDRRHATERLSRRRIRTAKAGSQQMIRPGNVRDAFVVDDKGNIPDLQCRRCPSTLCFHSASIRSDNFIEIRNYILFAFVKCTVAV